MRLSLAACKALSGFREVSKIFSLANMETEPYMTVQEVAAKFGWSSKTTRRLLADDPDVQRLVGPSWGIKRTYATLRIPMSVVRRLNERLTQPIPNPMEFGIKKCVIRRIPIK